MDSCAERSGLQRELLPHQLRTTPAHQSYPFLQSSFNPPKVPGKDDITGEPLSQRPDDTAVRSLSQHFLACVHVAYYGASLIGNFRQAAFFLPRREQPFALPLRQLVGQGGSLYYRAQAGHPFGQDERRNLPQARVGHRGQGEPRDLLYDEFIADPPTSALAL